MVYKFKLVSNEKSNFSRTIEVDADSNFLQLRNVILDSVGYSKEGIDSFFICDDDWGMHQEITLEDMGSSSDEDIYLMADTTIYDLVEEEGQKICFMFDYMTERSFYMELQEIIPQRHISEPICTIKVGAAPEQNMDMDKFEQEVEKQAQKNVMSTDIDDDFFGDAEFNEDEIDEGFDID